MREVLTLHRRALLAAAGATALCAPAFGASRKAAYDFDAGQFPVYDLAVTIDRPSQTLQARAVLTVPPGLIRAGEVVFALSEAAREVEVLVDGKAVTPLKRENAAHSSDLRRWSFPVIGGAGPVQVTIRHKFVAATGPVFALRPDGAVATGTAMAWYPQIERADGVRLEGTGTIRIVSGSDVVVAGGAALGGGAFHVAQPRYFDFAAAPYRMVSSKRGRARLYLLREHPDVERFAEHLDHLIGVLEAHFGPLPQERFDLAEAPPLAARDGGFDGASLDGFMLAVGFYFDQPFNTAFFGHEVSHQWWGGLVRRVGLDGVYLLDECMAQYGSLLAVEDIEGAAAAELYRRRGFPGYYAEYGGFSYLARSREGIDAPLTALPLADPFICRRVANAKGMIVWQMLADTVGRGRLSAFLKDFVRRHAYRRASLADLMGGVRGLLGQGGWFVDDWFDARGAADLSLAWTQIGGALALTIRQAGPAKRVRVPVEIRFDGARPVTKTVFVHGEVSNVTLPMVGKVSDVVLDPHYRVLRWTPAYRAESGAIQAYTKGDIALNYGKDSDARSDFEAALHEAPQDDRYGLRALVERGFGDLAVNGKSFAEAVTHYRQALALAPLHAQTPEVWRALADAYRGLGDEAQARAANENGAQAIAQLLRRGPAD